MNALLNVKVVATTTTQTKKAYTMYEMEVSGSILEPYTIFKRYSDFHALHDKLLKRLQSDDKLKKLESDDMLIIPDLPKKLLFGKNSKKVVHDRQKSLEEYLRTILKSEHLCKTDLIMDFLAVPKAWLHLIEPKKEEIKQHNRRESQRANDRRLKEQEEEEMRLALALSVSLAEENKKKKKKKVYKKKQVEAQEEYVPPDINAPVGWTAFRTADGRTFYQNDASGESQWEQPLVKETTNNNNNNNNNYNGQYYKAYAPQYYPSAPSLPSQSPQAQFTPAVHNIINKQAQYGHNQAMEQRQTQYQPQTGQQNTINTLPQYQTQAAQNTVNTQPQYQTQVVQQAQNTINAQPQYQRQAAQQTQAQYQAQNVQQNTQQHPSTSLQKSVNEKDDPLAALSQLQQYYDNAPEAQQQQDPFAQQNAQYGQQQTQAQHTQERQSIQPQQNQYAQQYTQQQTQQQYTQPQYTQPQQTQARYSQSPQQNQAQYTQYQSASAQQYKTNTKSSNDDDLWRMLQHQL